MKKISKSKKGFTLVEMVLVIAIICILAVAIVLNFTEYLKRADQATSAIASHSNEVESIVGRIDNEMASRNPAQGGQQGA